MVQATQLIAQQMRLSQEMGRAWAGIVYNVKDYGAIGDGKHDDTEALYKVSSLLKQNGGGVMFFPKGIFLKSGHTSIIIPSNSMVMGIGSETSIIKLADAAKSTTVFQIDNFATDVTLIGIGIDGNRANQIEERSYSILAYRASRLHFERMSVKNSYYIGLGLSNCYMSTVRSCSFERSYHCGLWVFSDINEQPYISSYINIDDVDAHYNDLDGIIVDANDVNITNSRFNYNGQDVHGGGALGAAGIYSEKHIKNLNISNTTCCFNTEFGINVHGEGIKATNSTCENNALAGIYIRGGEDNENVSLSNNTCMNNGTSDTTIPYSKAGIAFQQTFGITIMGNICFDDRPDISKTQTYGVESVDDLSSNVHMVGNHLLYNKVEPENVRYRTFSKTIVGNGSPMVDDYNPFAIAIKSTNQAIAAGALTKVLFQTEQKDKTGVYDKDNSRAVIYTAGTYEVQSSIAWDGQAVGNRTILDVYVNGAQKERLSDQTLGGSTSSDSLSSGSVVFDLIAGDVVEIYAYSTNLTNIKPGELSRFVIRKVA
ncbi:right-handed parallel beta-helix repeat-containing protein [Paenibacillus amylolyticus]|uniref:right-handed parallel beta-helix repeat-containing protein n=1 Tax=Paenibacillus amylolyticus TaxID=1451 RepID=UPI000B84D652|nr:glycosyl hydrolase family 28-related protein [Paenibacillus amylolyticus]